MSDLAAVLWDMDGTLVDTEPYWIQGEHEIVESFGGTWTDELSHQLVGQDLRVSAGIMRANSPITWDVERIVDELLGKVIRRVEEHVPWRPGARELLASLRASGIPCVLVTMSWTSLATAVVDNLPEATFTHLVTGDVVAHGKPHPEPYLAACRLLGVQPAQCVALEDSPTGVRSAVDAGVPTVAIPHILPVPTRAGSVQVDTLAGIDTAGLTGLWRAAAQSSPTTT